MKAPKGQGKWLIKNTVQKALHQSVNVIIDLRRIKIPQEKCVVELERQFKYSKRIKNMLVKKMYVTYGQISIRCYTVLIQNHR